MRILVCSWGNICESDLELSLKYMGHDIDVLSEKIKDKDYDASYLEILSNQLKIKKYDCVISINYIPIISRVCNIFQVKYISWIVDSPWFQLNSDSITNSCNYIFIFDHCLYEQFRDKFIDRIFYMPLGTNVKYWDSIKLTEEDKARFATDVSFVGSLYEDKHDYDNVVIPSYLRGYFDGIIEAQTNVYGYNFLKDVISEEAIEEFSKCANWNSMGKDYSVSNKEIVINEFIGKKCADVERHRLVSKIAKNFKFDLYTLSNTENMPYITNKGPADSRIDMPKIFKCSKINLNMTIKTIESGIPLRIYDIMGNGGFVLTNYQSELNEYFIPNEDLVIYESMDDMIYKISYYLQHEEERKRIAENGYKKVKMLYTVEKRLEHIFETVYQDKSKSYGANSVKSQNEFLSLIYLFKQLKITRILDAGLFLNEKNNFAKDSGIELGNQYILDGVQLIKEINCNINETIYKNIFLLNNLPNEHYDLIIIFEVFQYLKEEEMIYILKCFSRLTKTIIVDYDEEYALLLNEYKEYSAQKLEMGDCELLLITIN